MAEPDAKKRRLPMYGRILLGAALGTAAGLALQDGRLLPASLAEKSSEIGLMVIRLLKALAAPLILFAVLDAFLRTRIPARKGAQLLLISLVNAAVAILIGLTVANVLRSGEAWQGQMAGIAAQLGVKARAPAPSAPTLDPIRNIAALVPDNFVDPFGKNSVITIILIAVLAGAALRKLKDSADPRRSQGIQALDQGIHAVFQTLTQMLEWVVQLIPFAVFFVVAGVLGKAGTGLFGLLASYAGTVILGLVIHALIYYGLLLFVVARVSPFRFFGGALDAIVTAFSSGSSLATLPVTLKCLHEKLKVSEGSARLAACVGTHLNHDGIILYEAAATVFLAQALGHPLGFDGQLAVAFASVMAGIGIAGVPDAGLITLSLVLGAAGLPAELYVLFVPVDWLIGRCRATTNVLSDMTVAQVLDRWDPGTGGVQP
ncbi:MAG: dicarboxylate/amino acid:cation symporter [Planctomycetes bacterium]|nr:dicarboxylate/amino acid:cation symporter [Planctomycetota bacterium]